jgi:2-polyprenyl-6-methoxyphenol hydroxylase-like FAD-dependent oxidoreductase
MNILIVGSGIAGPTLAYWLSLNANHTITILEKSPSIQPHGQNVDIQGSAVTCIKKMGLMPQIQQHNTQELGTQFIDSHGKPLASFPVKEGSSASLTSEYEILRGDLAKILYQATQPHRNITYLFNTTITQILQNDSTCVRVQLSNSTTCTYGLLIAADGQWSKTRSLVFPPHDVAIKHQGMYAVYFTVPRLPTDTKWWNIFVAEGSRTVSTRPDPHGTLRAMFTCMPCTPSQTLAWEKASRSSRNEQEELVRSEFADAGWIAERLVDDMSSASDLYMHAINQVRMKRWSRNHVVCLGDAAFCPSPLTGMGTSLAVLGAYVLAGELSRLASPSPTMSIDALAAALTSYEDGFRPFVEQSQVIPPFVPGVIHPGPAWKRAILHSVLRLVSRVVRWEWVGRWSGDAESRDDGFKLPEYAAFEEEDEK